LKLTSVHTAIDIGFKVSPSHRLRLIWEVDVYSGVLDGIIIAEIELERENQSLALPTWIGREVTEDPLFSKSALRQRLVDQA
jgi:CYTH domain-containing protein